MWKLRDLLDPLAPHVFERFLARPTVLKHFCELVTRESRPNLSCSLDQAHAPFFVASRRTIILARAAVFPASAAYSTYCPLILGASVTISTATSAAVLFLVSARMSCITDAALRSSADFTTSCNNVSTFSRFEREVPRDSGAVHRMHHQD